MTASVQATAAPVAARSPSTRLDRAGERRRVAYILAPSHSGSTLLAMLLGSHPEVSTIGELNLSAIDNPDTYRCSCGERLRECAFWKAIGARVRRSGLPFDVTRAGTDFKATDSDYVRRLLHPLHRGPVLEAVRDAALLLSPSWRAAYGRTQRANAALVGAVLDETNTQVIVDSSKIGIRLKFLLRNPALDVRVIRLVRDGRAVALTYMDPANFADARDPRLRGGGAGGSRDGERLPIEDAAREWRRSHEEADALISRLDASRWTEVRYETLCLETEPTLRRLFTFLGVDPDRPRPDFRASGRHVVGNGMRLDRTSAVTLDERWKQVLAPPDHARFDAVAGQLNRRFGYEPSSP